MGSRMGEHCRFSSSAESLGFGCASEGSMAYLQFVQQSRSVFMKPALSYEHEFIVNFRFSQTVGDLSGDYAKTGPELVDEAKQGIAMNQSGAGIEKAWSAGGLIGLFTENGQIVLVMGKE